MNWFAIILLGALALVVVIVGIRLALCYYDHRMLLRRAREGTSTDADAYALLQAEKCRNPIAPITQVRLATSFKGGAVTEEAARQWIKKRSGLHSSSSSSRGPAYEPTVMTRWLLGRHDPELFLACSDAGFTNQELLHHLDGTAPITYGQAQMLAAFRRPSPDANDDIP